MPEQRRTVARCPACGEGLRVVRLECPACETAVEGRFTPSRFERLTPEQQDFLETFIRVRGNIREVERELGISYPTVRGRLDAIIETLGYRVEPAPDEVPPERRRAILDALNRGEITAEEAVKRLKLAGS